MQIQERNACSFRRYAWSIARNLASVIACRLHRTEQVFFGDAFVLHCCAFIKGHAHIHDTGHSL
jgi:hypothetical protein